MRRGTSQSRGGSLISLSRTVSIRRTRSTRLGHVIVGAAIERFNGGAFLFLARLKINPLQIIRGRRKRVFVNQARNG
ncbi:MAG: hypothetical protein ACREC9_16335 [Methylocella sp.]